MMRDYSYRYTAVLGGRQKVSGRKAKMRATVANNSVRPRAAVVKSTARTRAAVARLTSGDCLLKGAGVIVTMTMLMGVVSSYWLDANIRSGLDELARLKQQREEISLRHDKMAAQRTELLSRAYLVAAAEKLELYPMSEKQIRKFTR